MGLLWELFQESQIGKRKSESGDLEERVAFLEDELANVEAFLEQLVTKLEELTGENLHVDADSGQPADAAS